MLGHPGAVSRTGLPRAVGGVCPTRIDTYERSGTGTALNATENRYVKENFGWCGNRLGPVRVVIRLMRTLVEITPGAYQLDSFVGIISGVSAMVLGLSLAGGHGRLRYRCHTHCCHRQDSLNR